MIALASNTLPNPDPDPETQIKL